MVSYESHGRVLELTSGIAYIDIGDFADVDDDTNLLANDDVCCLRDDNGWYIGGVGVVCRGNCQCASQD